MDRQMLVAITETGESLVATGSAVCETIKKLDGVAKSEFSPVDAYEQAVKRLCSDVNIVTSKLRSTFASEATLSSSLLDTAATDVSLRQLLAALLHARYSLDSRLNDFTARIAQPQIPSVVAPRPKFLISHINGLDATRVTIRTRLEEFQSLFQLHESFRLRFSYQPFRISAKHLEGLQLVRKRYTFRFDAEWVERYSSAMRSMAKLWVDDLIKKATIPSLGRTQASLLQHLQILVDGELPVFQNAYPETYNLLLGLQAGIKKEIARERKHKFIIAFCGMVKAGKSLFINALMGRSILPSDELPSTAWPCRLRHVRGCREPSLRIDSAFFQVAIDRLKLCKYGEMMSNYALPSDKDIFADLLCEGMNDDDESADLTGITITNAASQEARRREIYNNWNDLHPITKANLLRFEQDDYVLSAQAVGEKDVSDLLTQVNDVVRLCRRLSVPLPKGRPLNWPVVECEFEVLRNQKLWGDFEFIDLPGIGETSCDDFHSFEDLVRMVAKEANALVPIVSFKEVAKDDWRQQLPEIIKAGLGRAPEMVICTHLDQVAKDRIKQQILSVANVFWPNSSDAHNRVLCCSSRMGLSARALLQQSVSSKPNFEDIWVEGRVAYDCAEKILGVGNPKTKYEVLEFDEWKEAVVDQLKESELESAITRLTTDIAMTKRGYILKVEGEQLRRMISKSIVDHNRLLSVMGRSQLQFELAYAAFKEIRLLFAEMLEDWRAEENRSQAAYMEKLHKAIHVLQLQGLTVAAQATEKTMSLSHWRKNIGRHQNPNILIFHHQSDVEFFVVSIQREMHSLLGSLKRQFVSFVRELANRCRTEYFDSLRDKIQKTIRDDAQNELMAGILDRLDAFGEDIEALLLPNIMKKVVHSIVAERYNAATAHRAIRNAIVGPLLTRNETNSNGTDADWTDVSTETSSDESASIVTEEKDIQQLGFMLRAPVAVLATIPWFLGVGVWLFMARSKQYLLNVESLIEELQERAIRPYFDGLHEEGVTTLENIGERSSKVAELAIHESLEEEERRYQQERSLKQKERSQNEQPRPIIAVSSMTLLLNLLAADSGLLRIQRHLTESKVVND